MKLKATLILIVGMASVGIASVIIKLCNAPPIVIATYRMSLSAIILAPIFLIFRKKGADIKETPKVINFIPLGAILAIHFVLWIASLKYTTVLSSTVLVTTNPIFVPIISYFIFKEKTKKLMIFAIIVSFIGSTLIAIAGGMQGFGENLGNLLAITGAIAVSFYLVLGKRVRMKTDLLTYIFYVYSFSAIFLILTSLITGQKLFGYDRIIYIYFVLLAVFPQLLGHTIFNWALEFFSPSFVALSILGEPIFATIFALLILKEVPSLIEIFGGAFVMTGIYIATRMEVYNK
jgi:drug/metabolite transporter (DMT)-like permease